MFIFLLILLAVRLSAQDSQPSPDSPMPERWNLFYQATSIGDYHGSFRSPYAGQFSLQNYPEHEASLTTTLFSASCWVAIRSSTSIPKSPVAAASAK